MRTAAALALLLALAAGAAGAARTEVGAHGRFDPALLAIDEARHLGAELPDVAFATEQGAYALRHAVAERPTIVVLGYYGCRGVCPTTLRLLADALRDVRTPHRVLVLSFDARDTLESLRAARAELGAAAADWTFGLLGADASARLTSALGYRTLFIERDRTYAHPNALVFVSPAGRVTRYLAAAQPQPRDVELALAEANAGAARAGSLIEQLRLACYTFDPTRSRYALHPVVLFGGAGVGVLALVGLVGAAYRPSAKGANG